MSAGPREAIVKPEDELSVCKKQLAEARHVAWLLWRDLRERELRGPSALRLARRYAWINRDDGETLE